MPATPSAADLLATAARRNALLDLLARTLIPTYGARRNAAAALLDLTAGAAGRRAAEEALQELTATATAAGRRAAGGPSAPDRHLHRPGAGTRESRHGHRAPTGVRL